MTGDSFSSFEIASMSSFVDLLFLDLDLGPVHLAEYRLELGGAGVVDPVQGAVDRLFERQHQAQLAARRVAELVERDDVERVGDRDGQHVLDPRDRDDVVLVGGFLLDHAHDLGIRNAVVQVDRGDAQPLREEAEELVFVDEVALHEDGRHRDVVLGGRLLDELELLLVDRGRVGQDPEYTLIERSRPSHCGPSSRGGASRAPDRRQSGCSASPHPHAGTCA